MSDATAVGRRFDRFDLADTKAPYNPLNGHDHQCPCEGCTLFWQHPLGILVASWARDLAVELGDR